MPDEVYSVTDDEEETAEGIQLAKQTAEQKYKSPEDLLNDDPWAAGKEVGAIWNNQYQPLTQTAEQIYT